MAKDLHNHAQHTCGKFPSVDFSTRNVVLIRGICNQRNEDIFVEHVASTDRVIRFFVSKTWNTIEKVPTMMVLVFSCPADKEIEICRYDGFKTPIPELS